MEDQKKEEAWYEAHKNDPDFKKLQDRCHAYAFAKNDSSLGPSDLCENIAKSMSLQNYIILATITMDIL